MEIPNKPLYGVGDILSSKEDSYLICKINRYNKGFLEYQYYYDTFSIKKEYVSKVLETPFNEWEETKSWSEEEIYNGIRNKEYKLRRSDECQEIQEASQAENPNQR